MDNPVPSSSSFKNLEPLIDKILEGQAQLMARIEQMEKSLSAIEQKQAEWMKSE